MDGWVSVVQMWNPLFQPPKHSGNGFFNINDSPNSWRDPSIHSGAALFNDQQTPPSLYLLTWNPSQVDNITPLLNTFNSVPTS
ncbi:hypothetical protein PAXRUDRAFT_20603 [Paxillus rubicundulus Ve08.2h10]|uniref:Unplaced genomic scaffold scaffold_4697, whole genome shotgun sequence n=1 Tax=Paxillus rubicundulus Ve08.2h10 TaxID=930991 RepID=A0A0D0CS32_9AGAM|nr:hypothetical protein PAXRUDRAFT_20603 [Paxillus rubicundulus Ve08.2h10]